MSALSGCLCSSCGEYLAAAVPEGHEPVDRLCAACNSAKPHFERAAAFGNYDAGLRGLIQLLKYEQVRPAAKQLGRWVADAIAKLEIPLDASVLVVPVPLYAARERQRGFNQANLIARAALDHMPESSGMRLQTGLLVRRRETRPQVGLTPEQRRENMRGAFEVSQREAVKGQTVLIIDDVMTTGTTASECARVLLRAGAARVLVATAARALKHGGETANDFGIAA